MRNFEFYEFTGILIPGTVTLLGLSYFFPSGHQFLTALSFGDFGLFLILAYATGHLTQAIGNLLENIWWKLWSGMPTDWVRSGSYGIISDTQRDILFSKIKDNLKSKVDKEHSDIAKKEWVGISRQIYSSLSKENRTKRIDIFNGNYGLHRGLAASFLILLILMPIILGIFINKVEFVLFFAFMLSLYRMHRFARYYARDLFVEFLQH